MYNDKEIRNKELSEFLKSKRSRIRPEDVGLPVGVRRRTPGLRREEVALLAGIGLTWYTWLEQGRDINVSAQILDSISRVLLLSREEKKYLYTLTNKVEPENMEISGSQAVSATLIHMLEGFDMSFTPAYIMDQYWNIVEWNKMAAFVFDEFADVAVEKRNVVKMMFCRRKYMELFEDWEYHAKGVISRFHNSYAENIDDPDFTIIVEELQRESTEFAKWWTNYDVRGMEDVVKRLSHPVAGSIRFDFISLDVTADKNLRILVHIPDQKTRQKLMLYFDAEGSS